MVATKSAYRSCREFPLHSGYESMVRKFGVVRWLLMYASAAAHCPVRDPACTVNSDSSWWSAVDSCIARVERARELGSAAQELWVSVHGGGHGMQW